MLKKFGWKGGGEFQETHETRPTGVGRQTTELQSLGYPHGYPKMDYTPDDMFMNV